jgi:transposase
MELSPKQWREERERLLAERDYALGGMAKLQESVDELMRMIAGQNDRLGQLVSMLRRREEQLKRSEREVRKLRRKLGLDDPDPEPDAQPVPEAEDTPSTTSPNETSPSADPGPKAKASPKGEPDADASSSKPRPRPRSRGGRRPPPEHLPSDVEHHEVCACGHCGGRTIRRDVLTTRLYTVIPSYVRCRVITRNRDICVDCGKPTTASMPPMPVKRALYDNRFLAWLVVMKFVLLVPLDRVRTLLLSQGIDIAMGTLVSLIERAADLLDPIDGEHLKQLRAGALMAFDGTGLKVLVQDHKGRAWDGYFEVFTWDELTVFQFDMTKHADRLQQRIREYAGIIVCDAESRNAAGAPDATLAYCNAHPLRKFRDAKKAQPVLASEGEAFIQELYTLEHEADRLELAGVDRVAYRQRHSRAVLERFRVWLEGVLALELPPTDPVARVARYYLKNWTSLTLFVDHAEIPLDNNASEREFQRHAKLRLASLFAGSVEGAHRWATLFGVVRTAQKCELDVSAYLNWVFDRRGSHRHQYAMAAAELTPMAYRDLVDSVAKEAKAA